MTIRARRRHGGAPIVLIVCGVLGFLAEGADGKPRRADLKVSAASLSGVPEPGARVKVRASVRNTGTARAPASRLSLALKGMRAPLARAKVPKLKPRKKKTVSLSAVLPRVIAPGRYAIVVCADAAKKVKERSEANNCRRLARALEVVAAPAVVPPAPGPVPTPPAPGSTPTPTPTRSPTPTPTTTATATPTATPDGEVPPEQLPPLITSVADTAETLYDGQGVVAGAIAPQRAGVLHGRVVDVDGTRSRGSASACTTNPSSARRRPAPTGRSTSRSTAARRSRSRTRAPATSRSSATSTRRSSVGRARPTS